MPGLVIGNGESRLYVKLEQYKHNHVLIGCNAIHRDISVDHLVCCDRRMVEEAVNNQANIHTMIYVRDDWYRYYRKIRKNKNINLMPQLPYDGDKKQDKPGNWGSGGYAVLLAAQLGHENISLLGFDLFSNNHSINNVYKGTINYSDTDARSVDPNYWIYQIAKVFDCYQGSIFTIYNQHHWNLPREWQKTNVKFVAI